ncbi:MAG: hypothetical protein ACFFCV_21205 [Promethearchaeota archaeon]
MSEIERSPLRKINLKTVLIIIFSLMGLIAIVITITILFSNSETNGGGG